MAKKRRYVGRSAVVAVAGGQADSPGQGGVRDIEERPRRRFRDDWRVRYAEAGGDYDEYDPAYTLGYTLAGTDEWGGRSWDEVEPHARESWERDRPGTWERFKDVIRRGWDWLTFPEDERSSMREGRS